MPGGVGRARQVACGPAWTICLRGKRRELAFVVEVLVEEFKREVSTRASPHLKDGEILKIVLFGSYARGDWVEDPVGRYFSDYDLLVVVEKEKFTDVLEFWEGAERRLLSALSGGRELRTPVNFIVHTLEDVNAQLERGALLLRRHRPRWDRPAGRAGAAVCRVPLVGAGDSSSRG